MEILKNKIINNRLIIFLLLIYFSLHLPNLTRLPIFNDESIYLDWGAFNTHVPGHLYDSLLDAKQPLLIWIFGIFENFFKDPLFAGRFVSVIAGSITAFGIFTLTQKLFNKQTAFIATLLYSIIPIFVFYNRQALMEASIATIGIWSFIALLNLLQKPTATNGIILGIVLGIGFFIKSSSLIFIVSSAFVILFCLYKEKKIKIVKSYSLSLITMACLNFLLFINPIFWQTLSSNSRYSYTLTELFSLPINGWINNIIGFFNIGIIFITPLVFVFSIIGIFLIKKNKIKDSQIFFSYFLLSVLLEIFLSKWQSQRYIVPFLPFIIIPASYVFNILWEKNLLKKGVVLLSFIIPLIFSLLIIFNPSYYIIELSKISGYSDTTYVYGQTSGYGINEAMKYMEDNSGGSKITMILFGLNIGNPESGVNLYSEKNPQLITLHIDSRFFNGMGSFQCLTSKYPTFFVARDSQQVGLDPYLSLQKSISTYNKSYSIGIYAPKKDCKGKAFSLSDLYQSSITKEIQIKTGN